jgi:putative cardiolipin synthase
MRKSITGLAATLLAATSLALAFAAPVENVASLEFVDAQIAAHPGQTGAYVLDSGEEALIARAWLADHAQRSIDVQYFIWSSDNIGILAADALLRAAERGVQVRVIVDDLLVDAPDESLLALAKHPNIDIRIYNPKSSVGVPWHKRIWNALTDFHGVNQRMHDKTFVVDGKVGVTGGRNMAAEYYEYHHDYNFRDRDVLLAGVAVQSMRASFERFWNSDLTAPVETLYDGLGLMHKSVHVDDQRVRDAYRQLHDYANSAANFAPEVRAAIASATTAFDRLTREAVWGRVDFICDRPGKNEQSGLSGGGQSTQALASLVANAADHVVIQSPYLVLSDQALDLFRETMRRGVHMRISTNSLASTDNLQAFAGYRNQRDELLTMGLAIFEYRPDAASQRQARQQALVGHLPAADNPATKFGLHAKTMVLDSKIAFIGTFNLDPRSANLNTEVGVVIYNERLARAVEAAIENDMRANNSWDTARDDPDQYVSFGKRSKVRFWQMLPIKPLL